MTGCELIKCPEFKDGRCTFLLDYVSRDTGEDCCPRRDDAVPKPWSPVWQSEARAALVIADKILGYCECEKEDRLAFYELYDKIKEDMNGKVRGA